MKRKSILIIAAVLVCVLLSGCCLSHEWQDASCETPKTCAKCGKTEGEALGHSWQDADCVTAKTCAACGKTEGAALGHTWQEANCTDPKTCSACGETEGEALGHDIQAVKLRKDSYSGVCRVCGKKATETVSDWESTAADLLCGTWTARLLSVGEDIEPAGGEIDFQFQFKEDGTAIWQGVNGEEKANMPGIWKFIKMHLDENYGSELLYGLKLGSLNGDDYSAMALISFDEPLLEGYIDEGVYLFIYLTSEAGIFCAKVPAET